MIKLCLEDYLLISQTSETIITPWKYKIIQLAETPVEIATENNITASYKLVFLDKTTYEDYLGKTLLLEIYNNSDVLLETDFLVISGVYNKFTQSQKLLGLLGENLKKTSENDSDWQDGQRRAQTVTTYTEAALTNELESYDWTQTFVTDFIPDARYQTTKVIQKEGA